jgi:hypothetical protein
MKALIIKDVSKFPIKATLGGVWQPTNNTISGDYWLQLEAKQDLDKAGIKYEVGEVGIKLYIELG